MNDWVWGVDLSTKSIDLACVRGDEHQLRTLTIAAGEPARRSAVAYTAITRWARSVAAACPPLIVWIELPVGRWANPELMAMYGVTRAAMWAGLSKLYAHPVSVQSISVTDWRKRSIGHGNADKDQILAWARSLGANPRDHNQAEALGIAIGGRNSMRKLAA